MAISIFGESARITNQDVNGYFANSILQTLNRYIPDAQTGAFYDEKAFNPADFEGVPIVYAPEHPDPFKNLEEGLKQVGGKIVGKLSNVRIVKGGTTRLVAGMTINSPEALALWRAGKLSLSTGLLAVKNAEGKITRITKAHHILIFKSGNGVEPKDKSVLITNQDITPTPVRCYEAMTHYEVEAAAGYSSMDALTNHSENKESITNTGEGNGLTFDPAAKKWL